MTIRIVVATFLLALTASLSAATFTVTSSGASGPGTLSQALLDANANPGLDQIRFAVAAADVPGAGLPSSTDPVDIDGLLPNGMKVIVFMPEQFDVTAGFKFVAGSSGSSLRNVQMDFMPNAAVVIAAGVTDVTIADNIFEMAQVRVVGNANLITDNIFLLGFNNEILLTGDMNVLLRNTVARIIAPGPGADLNEIGRVGAGNILQQLAYFGTGSQIAGNTFATSIAGLTAISAGAFVGTNTIAANTISGYATGIHITGSGFTITANSISNTGIPIDLGGNGPTPNDPAPDADTGANNLQNFPILALATATPGSLVVAGSLSSTPLTTFTIELFSNAAADPDARTFLGSFDVTTDAAGNASFTQAIAATVSSDEVITATATNDSTGDTSEVSGPVPADAPGQLDFSNATYLVDEAAGTVTITVNRTGGSEGTVTVQYATQSGTATAPSDYTTSNGSLTFGPGVTTQTFAVPIIADAIAEPQETFTVTLSAPTSGASLGLANATVIIAANLDIPTASTWALILLALALITITLIRIGD